MSQKCQQRPYPHSCSSPRLEKRRSGYFQPELSATRSQQPDWSSLLLQPPSEQEQASLQIVLEIGQSQFVGEPHLAIGKVRTSLSQMQPEQMHQEPTRNAFDQVFAVNEHAVVKKMVDDAKWPAGQGAVALGRDQRLLVGTGIVGKRKGCRRVACQDRKSHFDVSRESETLPVFEKKHAAQDASGNHRQRHLAHGISYARQGDRARLIFVNRRRAYRVTEPANAAHVADADRAALGARRSDDRFADRHFGADAGPGIAATTYGHQTFASGIFQEQHRVGAAESVAQSIQYRVDDRVDFAYL